MGVDSRHEGQSDWSCSAVVERRDDVMSPECVARQRSNQNREKDGKEVESSDWRKRLGDITSTLLNQSNRERQHATYRTEDDASGRSQFLVSHLWEHKRRKGPQKLTNRTACLC